MMVLKDVKKGIAILFSIAVLSFSITGCGGGGSGGDSAPAESEHVVIDENNINLVTGTVFDAIGVGVNAPILPLASTAAATSAPRVKVLEQPAAVKQVLSTSQNLSILAEGDPIDCTNGGFYSYSGSEITFSDCNESGIIIDGTVSVSSDSTSATMTFTNFSITQGSDIIFYESMTFAYTLDLSSMSITMDGYTSIFGERTDYQNYTFSIAINSNDDVTYAINGFIKTDCLGGWIEIRTTEDIQVIFPNDCPTAGQIVISGNASELTVDFNTDGSIDVSGSATEHYDSCYSLPTGAC
jgi:hypothetical protein